MTAGGLVPVIDPGDFPGLGAEAARTINQRVRPEWRALVAANVASAPPLDDPQRAGLAAVSAALGPRVPARKAAS